VRRDLVSAARLLTLPTLAFVIVAAFVPGRLPLAVRVYALVVCGLVLGIGLAALHRSYPPVEPLRRRARESSPSRQPPPVLARLEDEAALAVARAFDLHYRLAPRLRRLAAGLLASRRRVSLEDEPDQAQRILGDEAWALVRGDRQPPDDRLARGIAPEALAGVVTSLERV